VFALTPSGAPYCKSVDWSEDALNNLYTYIVVLTLLLIHVSEPRWEMMLAP
jgi:hypothetical protein